MGWMAKTSSVKSWQIYCIIASSVVILFSMATQFVAWRFNFHSALGEPWFGSFYAPWSWIGWQAQFHSSGPQTFKMLYAGMGVYGAMSAGGLLLYFSMRGRTAEKHEGIHGTAHWADEEEVKATGLLSGKGVYVGGWLKGQQLHYLRHDGPEHIAAIAPTRSGKGVGLVVPTLLSWRHSLVVNDLKAELWQMTAGWREKEAGNKVLRFDPAAAEGSVGFNPLDEIRLGTIHEVGDVQNLVTILVDPDGKGLVDHWAKTSHAFLTGAILHVLYQARKEGRTGCLPDVALALSDPRRPIEGFYRDMLHNKWVNGDVHPTIAAASRDMTNRPDEERGSVLSTSMSFLSLYRDPLIAKNVSHSDFRILDLMNGQQPVSLYLVVKPEDKDRLKPLMRLIINQLMRVLLRPDIQIKDGRSLPPHKQRMLLMLDEFPSYGKLEVFQEALAYIAGYGIKAYLIMQDISQLNGAYGRDESIISNCHVRIAYAPNKIETAEWLSRMAGTTTIVKQDITQSGNRYSASLSQISQTYHQIARALITPDEVMRLRSPVKDADDTIIEPGDTLIFVAGHAPIQGTQSLYFQNPVFLERSQMAAPSGSSTGKTEPFLLQEPKKFDKNNS